jgi:hypothetical protein
MASQLLKPFRAKHLRYSAIADEPVTCPALVKHTLHPGDAPAKPITLRWVQGVWVMPRILDGKEHLY